MVLSVTARTSKGSKGDRLEWFPWLVAEIFTAHVQNPMNRSSPISHLLPHYPAWSCERMFDLAVTWWGCGLMFDFIVRTSLNNAIGFDHIRRLVPSAHAVGHVTWWAGASCRQRCRMSRVHTVSCFLVQRRRKIENSTKKPAIYYILEAIHFSLWTGFLLFHFFRQIHRHKDLPSKPRVGVSRASCKRG